MYDERSRCVSEYRSIKSIRRGIRFGLDKLVERVEDRTRRVGVVFYPTLVYLVAMLDNFTKMHSWNDKM
jgi:hypothetical protein